MKYVHNAVIYPDTQQVTTKVLLVQDLRLPVHIALGLYEAATQEELDDLIADLEHERARRSS